MGGGRLLTVDDEAGVLALLKQILEKAGYQVDQASDGAQALALARTLRPDLVLLDVRMPGMNGFDVCRALKADPDLRDTPVIMCTSETRKESLVEAIRAGAEDYISKPFDAEAVVRRVGRALAARSNVTPPVVGTNLRGANRKSTRWKVSWSAPNTPGFATAYKCRVLDISLKGMAFEFVRCSPCTGYEQGTVHPQCLFASVARRFERTQTLSFVLSVSNDIVLEVRGKIAHVFQPLDTPTTERVGVEFTHLPPECAAIIEQYVAGALAL